MDVTKTKIMNHNIDQKRYDHDFDRNLKLEI